MFLTWHSSQTQGTTIKLRTQPNDRRHTKNRVKGTVEPKRFASKNKCVYQKRFHAKLPNAISTVLDKLKSPSMNSTFDCSKFSITLLLNSSGFPIPYIQETDATTIISFLHMSTQLSPSSSLCTGRFAFIISSLIHF